MMKIGDQHAGMAMKWVTQYNGGHENLYAYARPFVVNDALVHFIEANVRDEIWFTIL